MTALTPDLQDALDARYAITHEAREGDKARTQLAEAAADAEVAADREALLTLKAAEDAYLPVRTAAGEKYTEAVALMQEAARLRVAYEAAFRVATNRGLPTPLRLAPSPRPATAPPSRW